MDHSSNKFLENNLIYDNFTLEKLENLPQSDSKFSEKSTIDVQKHLVENPEEQEQEEQRKEQKIFES